MFVPRRLLIPLAGVNIAAVTAMWTAAGALGLSDRATDMLAAGAGTFTGVSAVGWITLGVAYLVRDRNAELLIKAAVEAKKRGGKGPSGPLRRVQ